MTKRIIHRINLLKNNNNNINMRGRILSIKKTTLLKLSFVINSSLFLVSLALSLTILSIPNLWFFSFLIAISFHLIIRSILFHLDSSCYFGSLLLSVGGLYLYSYFLHITNFYPVFIILSFAIASFCCGYFFKQGYHFWISFSLFFIAIFCFLYLLNIISLWIFLAIIAADVLLLIGSYFLL